MKKAEIKKNLEIVIDKLMDFKLSEMMLQSITEAQNDLDKNATAETLGDHLELLSGWLDEYKKDTTIKQADKAETKKALAEKSAENATFKWLDLEGYKKLSLKNTTFETLKIGDKIVMHYSDNVKKSLKKNNYFYGNTTTLASDMTFNNNQDVCSIVSINDDEITVKSVETGESYYIYADNINISQKSKKCVLDCGIPFMCYSKIA